MAKSHNPVGTLTDSRFPGSSISSRRVSLASALIARNTASKHLESLFFRIHFAVPGPYYLKTRTDNATEARRSKREACDENPFFREQVLRFARRPKVIRGDEESHVSSFLRRHNDSKRDCRSLVASID